ncbi:MAG: sigma-70 family RNA polymerase sigma factor [Planctomycetota bacterium]
MTVFETETRDARTRVFTRYDDTTELATLVAAAQGGDRLAFGELVDRYEGMVRSVALRRLGDFAEAQELCQEVFIKAMQRLHQLKEPAALGGWLRQITVRMAINRQVRRKPTVSAEPQTLEATCVDGRTPLDSALADEQASQVRDGLGRLGDLDRDTLVAFYVRGESLLEMSASFEAPVGTIKRRLHVARKRLAVELESLQAV